MTSPTSDACLSCAYCLLFIIFFLSQKCGGRKKGKNKGKVGKEEGKEGRKIPCGGKDEGVEEKVNAKDRERCEGDHNG